MAWKEFDTRRSAAAEPQILATPESKD